MSTDQTDYELFVSYARKDNKPIPDTFPHGWVTAVKDFIIADHRQYSADPMQLFFDTTEIRDMDDWRNRILGALRRSKVLLVCLSPNYFASLPCKWEWDEFLARQVHKLVGSEPQATVYFVEVPGSDGSENARRLNAIMGSNFTDLRPWFLVGAAAILEEAVRCRMAVLGQSVWERISRARRALSVPGNLRSMTPYFLGRHRELAELHKLVGVGKIGLVAAIHGLGGQGKTELSVAYARGYADCYPLGLWALEAENEKELLPLLGKLAFKTEFGYAPTEVAKNDGLTAGKEVLAELQRRFDAVKAKPHAAEPAALVLLDNVSEPGLLATTQLSTLPKVDWLRVIATTRLDPKLIDPAGKAVGTVVVDALDLDTALRVIENHQPGERFRTVADEAAAREIVAELGGFTLAVEQVAVFLAVNPDVTPGDYLLRLRSEGLHETDALVDAQTEGQIEHQQKRLRPVLEAMLASLPPTARTLLGFAALLPPDSIPWPWLKELTLARHPVLGAAKTGYPDPWIALRRQVEGLRLITASDRANCGRMHRLIAAHMRAARSESVVEHLAAVTEFLTQVGTPFLPDIPIELYLTAWHAMPATAQLSARVRDHAGTAEMAAGAVTEQWVELAYQLGDLGLEEWWLDRWERTAPPGRDCASKRAAFLHRTGATREACALLKQALAAGPHFYLSSQLLMYLAQLGHHAEARELAERIERDHADTLAADPLKRARLLHRKYFILHELELNCEALAANRFTLEVYAGHGLEYDSLIATVNLGDTLWALGQVTESAKLLRTALDRSRSLGLSHVENIATVCLANVLSAGGDYAEATALYERGVELSTRIGHLWDQLYARTYRTLNEVEQGRDNAVAFDDIRDAAVRSGYEYIAAMTDAFQCAAAFSSVGPAQLDILSRARQSPFASCRLYALSAAIRDALAHRRPVPSALVTEWASVLRIIQGVKGRVGVIARTADWVLQSGIADERTMAQISDWVRQYVPPAHVPHFQALYAFPDVI